MTIKLTFYSLAILLTHVKRCIKVDCCCCCAVVMCRWESVVAFILVIADARCYQESLISKCHKRFCGPSLRKVGIRIG